MDLKEESQTAESYEALEKKYETERNKPMPSKNHSTIQFLLSVALGKYLNEFSFFTELSLTLPDVKPAVPDVAIYPKTKIDLFEDEIKVSEPPITAIEILSPTQSVDEVKDKIFDIYFPGGVKSAWLIIPTVRTVYIFTPDKKVALFRDGLLKDEVTGIELTLNDFLPQ